MREPPSHPVPERTPPRPDRLGAFAVPAFRRFWLADVFSAWGAEMETLIVAWYVLVQTDSPFLVSLVAALRFGGTLLAPATGVLADRLPRRSLLIALRAAYTLLSASVVLAALTGALPIVWVFVVAGLSGLLRPSEMILRQSLIADCVPRPLLANAIGFGRTPLESARVAGPLIGAGLLSTLGIGPAYLGVTLMYLASVGLSMLITPAASPGPRVPARAWSELLDGLRYVRRAPVISLCLVLAFLANLTAFPITLGLLPVIARDVLGADANGLALMSAAVAAGALAGSVLVAVVTRRLRPERVMLASLALWHLLIVAFAMADDVATAYVLLALIGLASAGSMVPIAVMLMSETPPALRGRVMGVRMLAVYGLPLGLLAAGALVEWAGPGPTIALFGTLGLLPVLAAAAGWRRWCG